MERSIEKTFVCIHCPYCLFVMSEAMVLCINICPPPPRHQWTQQWQLQCNFVWLL